MPSLPCHGLVFGADLHDVKFRALARPGKGRARMIWTDYVSLAQLDQDVAHVGKISRTDPKFRAVQPKVARASLPTKVSRRQVAIYSAKIALGRDF